MDNTLLYSKLTTLPENLKSEVSDFIDFLLMKSSKELPNDSKPKPRFGSAKGMFILSSTFEEPLQDFNEYM